MGLDSETLNTVTRNMKAKLSWKKIASRMGFRDHASVITMIEHKNRYSFDALYDNLHDILIEWNEQVPDKANKENMINILRNEDCNELADQLEGKSGKRKDSSSSASKKLERTRPVKYNELSKLAGKLGHWKRFAIEHLHVPEYEIKKAEQTLVPDMNPYNPSMYVLQYWSNKNGDDATVEKMIKLLEKAKKDGYIVPQVFDEVFDEDDD